MSRSPHDARGHLDVLLATGLTYLRHDPNFADDGDDEMEGSDAGGSDAGCGLVARMMELFVFSIAWQLAAGGGCGYRCRANAKIGTQFIFHASLELSCARLKMNCHCRHPCHNRQAGRCGLSAQWLLFLAAVHD